MVSNAEVRRFWEGNPVAAAAIGHPPGTPEFFARFDALREADDCEPYALSNRIHGYEDARGLRVLDVGCGNGYVLSRYAVQGAKVAGVDITQTALDLTARRFDLLGLPCELARTDGDRLPFEDESFDVACAMGVLHHVEDPRPMLAEMRRVLVPGGRLILMLYHARSWKARVVLPLKWLLLPRYRGRTFQAVVNANDGEDCPLARLYTREEARALLDGFEDVRFDVNQLSWRQLLLVPGLDRLLGPLLPACSTTWFARTLGWNLYVRARRPERA